MKDQQMIEETIKEIAECNKESCQDCRTICTYFYAIKRFCELFFSEDSVVLNKTEKQKLLKGIYEQGKFDALADLEKNGKVVLTKEELNEKYVIIDALVQCKEELEFIKRRNADTNEKIASEIADYVKKSRKETVKNIIDEIKGQRLEIRIFTDKKRYIVEESFLDEILKRYD